jgi:photosynthetic reaction center cytochrome c subunit
MRSITAMRGALAAYLALVGAAVVVFLTLELPPVVTQQTGYRGTAMEQVHTARAVREQAAANVAPAPLDPVEPSGTKSSEVYQNVQVLGDVDADEFTRLMSAITEWVSPEQGCAYCHAEGEELSSDSLYTKVVARRMLQMTQHLNADWGANHVAPTGVTCYTCHRGQPVPANIWFKNPGPKAARGMAGYRAGQNIAAPSAGLASLPYDPFTPFLLNDENVRVISTTALPTGNDASIKHTEVTYAQMIHQSEALGVNCTYCHNSRSFADWNQSNAQRTKAWYGIRMVRDLNNVYLEPLGPTYPPHRLGPLGDAPKANCATCHQGANKPLLGANMLKDYPELGGPTVTQ